jgi:uncharacterized protein (TIGR02271 family)
MGITTDQIDGLTDGNVVSTNGDKIGGIGQIYLDDNSGEPNWVTVKTGLFGTSESFVPLDGADLRAGDIVVKYDKATIKDAPRVDADGSITPEEEDALYSYYGLSGNNAGYTTDTDRDYATTGTTDTDHASAGNADLDDNTRGTKGYDISGPETDDAMTLSEERVEVGTQKREAGRARLRKYVVTENVTKTVPVQREEVRLEREPITEENRGAAESGPAISEEEHELVLHEERPVVEKEAVPVERVRLDTETTTEQQTVTEAVRKEEIELDTDADVRRS